MTIFETVKRTIIRSSKRVDQWIGYGNRGPEERGLDGPSLIVRMPSGYEVRISFTDLAYLVRAADDKAKSVDVAGLENWRERK